ncbi:MAG: hypothetical protein FJ301_09120 [Planctomycetes bacterium]|nr:hypothetical protein [Planctomycetota bacterium]
MTGANDDPQLALTVAAVWRQARASCPHPDLLASWLHGGVDGGARRFVDFHLGESCCPTCNAVVDDLRARDARAVRPADDDARARCLHSTLAAVRSARR